MRRVRFMIAYQDRPKRRSWCLKGDEAFEPQTVICSAELHSTFCATRKLSCFHHLSHWSYFPPQKIIWSALCLVARHTEGKGIVWPPSLAHPPQDKSWPLSPVPPAAQSHSAWEELVKRRRLRPTSEHSDVREDATPGGQGHGSPCVQRGTTSLGGSSCCECTTTEPPFTGNIQC